MKAYLETARLILRPFTEADEEDLYELNSDPAVMRFLNGGVAIPRARIRGEILPCILRRYERRDGYGTWAAVERSTGAFVGWFSVLPRDEDHPDEVELGYRLRRSAWGCGYATEGARALIGKAFSELGAERVFATTYQDNLASRRVMVKAGLRLTRTFRVTAADLAGTGNYDAATSQDVWDGDDVEYAVSRAEWDQREGTRGDLVDHSA